MPRVFSASSRMHRAVAATLYSLLALPVAGRAVDFHVAGLTVTQATQTDDQAVPLVADRRAHVRVFVLADSENQARPKVRLQFFYGRKARHQTIVSAPGGLAGVPIELARHDHAKSWNVTVPAAWIQPGLKLVAEVDPDRRVRESNENNNRWPNGSGQAFDVRKARPWKLTLVPIRLPGGRTSEATTSNIESYVSFSRRLFPVPEKLDVVVHSVFTTDTYVEYPSEFTRLVHQIDALRLLERTPERYYAGLINPEFTTIAGMGWIPGKASVSAEYPLLVDFGRITVRESNLAHELGHNLGLSHAPCGGAVGADRNYPYLDGKIGRPGYDVFVSRAYAPERAGDIMGYCATEAWISDFNYMKVLTQRERVADAFAAEEAAAPAGEVESLLVWGRDTAAGWVLEPAFRVGGVPEVVTGSAARVVLVDAAGRVVARAPVRLALLDHSSERGFAALVPLPRAGRLAAWRLEIDGRVVAERRAAREADRRFAAAPRAFRTDDETLLFAWDAEAQPLALLRDADTGEVLSFARGGRLELASRAQRVEVLLSDGVDSTTERFEVP